MRERAIDIVIHGIRDRIRRGEYAEGSQLPSKGKLAGEFGCSAITVDRALVQLADEGDVLRIRRKGTLVRSQTANNTLVALMLSRDPHTNDALAGPMCHALSGMNCQVEPIPVIGPIASAVTKLKNLGNRTTLPIALVSLFTHAQSQPEDGQAFASVLRRFPNRLIVAPECQHRDRRIPETHLVSLDARDLCRQVLTHLLGLGHRCIAVDVGLWPEDKNHWWIIDEAERLLAGSDCRFIRTYFGGSYRSTRVRDMLEQGATAFWAITDEQAVQAVNEIHRMGLRVPEDISVMGRNDTPWSEHCLPPLSSTSWRPEALAAATASALEKMMTHSTPPGADAIRGALSIRESTSPPNAGIGT